MSSASGQPTVDNKTSVIDKTATMIIENRPHAVVDAKHHPPGQPSPTNGRDVIIALGADDTIKGLGGNDSLVGGASGVVLFGGPGADHFIFETLKASPPRHPDTIMDFNHRLAGGEVQVNVNANLAPDLAIVMHGAPTLHASDFIL